MVHNILIAVDDTPSARVALEWAQQLVAHQRSAGHPVEATILNVIDGRTHEGVDGFGYAPDHEELRAEKFLNELLEPGESDIDVLVRAGNVASTILEAAKADGTDLIVVGTRHEGTIRQAMMGSVSQSLAAARERPVAVVPEESIIGTDRTVVGYDGSPGSRAALRWALANCEGAIRVVRAVSLEDESIEAHESLVALLPALGPDAAGRVCSEVVVGDPVTVLADAYRNEPQIIVGARTNTDAKDAIWGSTTTNVLANTTRPVVVVPPGMWD